MRPCGASLEPSASDGGSCLSTSSFPFPGSRSRRIFDTVADARIPHNESAPPGLRARGAPQRGYSVVGFTALEWGEHTMRGKNGERPIRGPLSRIREERGVFLKLTEKDGLWKKIRNHVGTTVEHPVSPATRNIRSRISDEGVKKAVSVCPYCAVGCSTLVYHRDGRIID